MLRKRDRALDIYSITKILFKRILHKYHNIEVIGKENIPKDGALLVTNHPGQLFYDAICIASTTDEQKVRFVAHHFDFKILLLKLFIKMYHGLELDVDSKKITEDSGVVKALKNEDLLCIFPEQSYHTYKNKYTLFKFNNHFTQYAKLSKKPIIPMTIVGPEEILKLIRGPKFKNIPLHIPIGLFFPLKKKVTIEFGKPIYYDNNHKEHHKNVRNEVFRLMKKHRKNAKKSNIDYLKHYDYNLI